MPALERRRAMGSLLHDLEQLVTAFFERTGIDPRKGRDYAFVLGAEHARMLEVELGPLLLERGVRWSDGRSTPDGILGRVVGWVDSIIVLEREDAPPGLVSLMRMEDLLGAVTASDDM